LGCMGTPSVKSMNLRIPYTNPSSPGKPMPPRPRAGLWSPAVMRLGRIRRFFGFNKGKYGVEKNPVGP